MLAGLLYATQEDDMRRKMCFSVRPYSAPKRVLIMAATVSDCAQRADSLRHRGYEVDCVTCSEAALTQSRSRSYDLVLLAVDTKSASISRLSRQLRKLNPDTTIACLADDRKPIPHIPCSRLLWTAEPMEYFIARVEALAATA
jgi:PleD family two-component response regulator